MNTIQYLKDTYGYDNPIIFKNLRIGGKTKTALRQELYRESKKGSIVRYAEGIYFFPSKKIVNKDWQWLNKTPTLPIGKLIEAKYLYKGLILEGVEINRIGYFSGFTMLNMSGISPQVPNYIEITTNNTSNKKRTVYLDGEKIIIRKPRIEITYENWEILQFLDLLAYVDWPDLNNEAKLNNLKKMCKTLTKKQFEKYIKYYDTETIKKVINTGLINEIRKS